MSNAEKEILNEEPDFDNQRAILAIEKKQRRINRRFYLQIICFLFLIITIVFIAYQKIYFYADKGLSNNVACKLVNLSDPSGMYELVNISMQHECKPLYNINYYGEGRALFNIDIYGDESEIYNKTNQMSDDGNHCILNCDADEDGFPDYNIDVNGDKKADLNIVSDSKDNTCDKMCDDNKDMIPDDIKQKMGNFEPDKVNLDINYDGICDINCDLDNDLVPDLNIDTNDDGIADLNVDTLGNLSADTNIDTDNDGKCNDNCVDFLTNDNVIKIDIKEKDSNIGKLDINPQEIEPGNEGIYNIIISNNTNKTIKYNLVWQDVTNGYNEYNNLSYSLYQNFKVLKEELFLPSSDEIIGEVVIAPKCKMIYSIKITANYASTNTLFKGIVTIKK